MKCTIPEISWHNREPVLSVDINPISNECYRLATSGGDNHVLIWQMSLNDNGAVKQELISDLTRHQKAVNVVRWSPSGQYLASADDDANIIIWQLKTDNIPLLEGDTEDKEIWIVYKVLRGHKEDIYDLCWSVDGLKLLSGSIDNTAILWDLSKGKMDHILSDHKGFVQGVAWDPKDQLIATISTDRVCRIFSTNGKRIKARLHKGHLPVSAEHYLSGKEVKYFHDDTFKSFFRRLQFSPDGSLLVVPSGHIETDDCKKTLNATLVFTLNDIQGPTAVLPLRKQSSTVVRFCPVLFALREDGPKSLVDLPYRMVFAVGTDHDVILYDTQQHSPFARLQEIHYTRLTDLAWSNDGRLLIASSTDGFCALITFEADELGVPYVSNEIRIEEQLNKSEELEKDDTEEVDKEIKVEEKKRPSFIEQWAINAPKRVKLETKTATKEENGVIEIVEDEDDAKELPKEIREEINKLIPRRATSKLENDKINEKSVAKPIAVRRKPKTDENATKDAKPIEVRRKPRGVIGDLKVTNTVVDVTKSVTNDTKDKEKTKETKTIDGETKQSDEVIEIKDDTSTNRQSKKSQKNEDFPKIKVPSLVKKKPTQPKNSPLLKFLKSPSSKAKKTTKKELSTSLDLTLEEEEARDAWKCEKDVKEANDKSKTESKPEPMEEDCTEDFCLQLEESQEKTQNEVKVEKPEPAKPVEILKDKNTGVSNEKLDKFEVKKPRRVALITLSSPKGKKKQKP